MSGAAREELEHLRETGVIAGGVALLRSGQARDTVLVRPVIGDDLAGWMPDLERSLDISKGVVGISGADMPEVAALAADIAAWLGDKGKTVVLVDAVAENPVLGKALDQDKDEGLVDVVLFGVSPATVVRRTLAPGVSVITAGSHPLSIESLFESEELPKMLRGLAEDALVLVLVPPIHLPKTRGALDAAVCVAGSAAYIASLTATGGGVRTTGILVQEQSETERAEEPVEEEPDEASVLVLPVHEESGATLDAEAALDAPAAEALESGRREAETGAEPAEHPPLVVGASSRRGQRAPNRVAAAAALLLIIAVATMLWWFVDGEQRFGSRFDRSVRTGREQPAEVRNPEAVEDERASSDDLGEVPGADQTVEGESEEPGAVVVGEPDVEPAGESLSDESPEGESLDGESLGGEGVINGPGGPYHIMISSHRHEGAAVFEAGQVVERGISAEVVATEVKDKTASPNPFAETTSIAYSVPTGGGFVDIVVYDINGREVRSLVRERMDGGAGVAVWDGFDNAGESVASGVYFARLDIDGLTASGKLIMLK